MINIVFNEKIYTSDSGTSLEKVLSIIDLKDKDLVVAGVVNNQLCDLSAVLESDCQVKFITMRDEIGCRIYRRSLLLVMIRVIYELFPESRLSVEHSLSNGIYCELHKESPLSRQDLNLITGKMREIIKANRPITALELPVEQVKAIFLKQGFLDKVELLKQLKITTLPLYELDGIYDYLYYRMVPRTGYLKYFKLRYKMPGFILLSPQRFNPREIPEFIEQPKLASIFNEYEKWGEIIGVGKVSDLNRAITAGQCGELIRITEALHEKKIASIADKIADNINRSKVILIAGPSSSGKTTFAQRLAIQLRVNGLKPVAISTDDYFIDRDKTRIDEDGNYDFESIEAIDISLFNEHLIQLMQGKRVEIPLYNFHQGSRENKGRFLQIDRDQPIIIEGIHGLNERLTTFIPGEKKMKIYVSALTQLNIDSHNRIPTTDTRLIRRIIRDHKFRNHDARKTITYWPGVRKGEEKNIFPYQENADLMFNSALIYELAVLRRYAEPLLEIIKPDEECYYQARRLLEFLQCFQYMPEDEIPAISIIREFIGG
jgi:uridine kinase